MQIWDSLGGILEVELTSAELEVSLKTVNSSGIVLSYIHYLDEMTCRFRIYRRDLKALKTICKKGGTSLRILHRKGLFWMLKKIPSRPVLLVGLPLILAATLFLPTRILFITVDGNRDIPAEEILSAAEKCGIGFWAERREVRSEKVKNALLHTLPQLQWAGVNTSGCTAAISVRERAEPEQEERRLGVSSIVASRDGYILSGTATQGSPLFQPGQTVRKGQILISGYTDLGICLQGTRAQGEVFAQTKRELQAVTPQIYAYRGPQTGKKYKISLLLRKKRINLWKDSGISGTSCDRMYQEYYLSLPGGFHLPFALCIETYREYGLQKRAKAIEAANAGLERFADKYLHQQMVAGSVLDRTQTLSSENGVYQLTGAYLCTEMIGREQQEQIGVQHGKSS